MPLVLTALTLATFAGADIDAFFDTFAEKRADIDVVRARFIQEEQADDETFLSRGTIIYEHPRKLLIRFDDPQEDYLLDGFRIYNYVPDLNQVEVFDLKDEPEAEALFLGFESDTTRLRKAYDIALRDVPDDACGTAGLELTPKAPSEADAESDDDSEPLDVEHFFDSIQLILRETDYLPCEILIKNAEGSEVLFKIHNYEVEVDTDATPVRVHLPEGVRIIEDDRTVEIVGPGGKFIPAPVLEPEPEPAATEAEPAAR